MLKNLNFSILLLSLFLAGCVKRSTSISTLSVRSVSGQIVHSEILNSWSLPYKRDVNFQVCLEDYLGQPVGKHSWKVEKVEKAVSSQESGCLNWVETFDFNSTLQPLYLPLKRKIVEANGKFSAVEVQFYLNPWSQWIGDEPAVIDPRYIQKVKRLARVEDGELALKKSETLASLFFDFEQHQIFGSPSKINLYLKPLLKTNLMEGEEVRMPLEFGKVSLRLQLFYQPEDQKNLKPLHQEISLKNKTFQRGRLEITNLDLNLKKELHQNEGHYYLKIEVEPEDLSFALKPFSHIFSLGPYSRLAQGQVFLETNSPITDGSGASGSPPNPNIDLQDPEDATVKKIEENPNFIFKLGLVKATFGDLKDNPSLAGPLGRSRQILFTVSVKNQGPSAEPFEGRKFRISSLQKGGMAHEVSVREGQLAWSDILPYSQDHEYDPVTRTVQVTDLLSGQSVEKTMQILPLFRFVVDKEENSQLWTSQEKPFLSLDKACIKQQSLHYSLHPQLLDMTYLNWTLDFSFLPQLNFKNLSNTMVKRNLTPGFFYRVTLALYSYEAIREQNQSAFLNQQPLTVGQKDVQASADGRLDGSMTLDLDPLSSLMATEAVVQIDILDQNKKTLRSRSTSLGWDFKPQVFSLNVSQGGCGMVPLPAHTSEFIGNSDVANVLNAPGFDLNQVAQKWQKDRKYTLNEDLENTGWKQAAQNGDLEPIEIKSPEDLKTTLGWEVSSLEEAQKAFDCAYAVENQPQFQAAKCMYDDHQIKGPRFPLYQALAYHWWEKIRIQALQENKNSLKKNKDGAFSQILESSQQQWLSHVVHEDSRSFQARLAHFYEDPVQVRKLFRVKKLIHPYKIAQTENLEGTGFANSEISKIKKVLESVPGTEHMVDKSIALSKGFLSAALKVARYIFPQKSPDLTKKPEPGASPPLVDLSASALAGRAGGAEAGDISVPSSKKMDDQKYEGFLNELKNMFIEGSKAGLAASLKAYVKTSSFRWIFNFQIFASYIQYATQFELEFNRIDLNLDLQRYRECYSVEGDAGPPVQELADKLGWNVEETYRPRFYFCFPIKNESKKVTESYAFALIRPEDGLIFDTEKGLKGNRFFLSYRGQDNYRNYVEDIRNSIDFISRSRNLADLTPEPVSSVAYALMDKNHLSVELQSFPGTLIEQRPEAKEYDLIVSLENWWKRTKRWIKHTASEEFNFYHDHSDGAHVNGASPVLHQNNPELRRFNEVVQRFKPQKKKEKRE